MEIRIHHFINMLQDVSIRMAIPKNDAAYPMIINNVFSFSYAA